MGIDWRGILGGIAPTLATALGGPLAGKAVAAISSKLLGKPDGTPEEVAAAIAGATPEQLEALRKLEQEFTLALVDKAVELEQIEAGDRANARQREITTHDVTTRVLAYGVTVFFGVQMWLLHTNAIPAENRDAANQLIGVLYMAVGTVLTYYFGSSSGSRAKDAVLSKIVGTK